MIDVHCHLLPGIDDGPSVWQESIEMARHAEAAGTKHCILTPHILPGTYDNTIDTITPVFTKFKQILIDNQIQLTISMAAEVHVCSELPMLLQSEKIPFLGNWYGKKAILLELPYHFIPVGFEQLLNWLLAREIIPVIAHPERNKEIIINPQKASYYSSMGCLLQITASSINGLFGRDSQACAFFLINRDLITFVASDGHNLYKRQPSLQIACKILPAFIGEDKLKELVVTNPGVLLT